MRPRCSILRPVTLASVLPSEGNDLALGCEIMIFVAAVNIPEAWAMVHAGLLRGLGHTSFVALYSLISIAVVRPILTFFLV